MSKRKGKTPPPTMAIAKQEALTQPQRAKAGDEFSATVSTSVNLDTGSIVVAGDEFVDRIPSEIRAHYEMWIEIRKETDRGAAILAVAYVERILQDVIRSFFYVNQNTAEEIFGPEGLLVSLSAKAKLGYCLGLYGLQVAKDINTIGTIRNKFAHRKELLRFGDKQISSLCYRISQTYQPYFDINPENPPRSRYLGTVQGIGLILAAELIRPDRPKPLPPLFGGEISS